MRNKARKLLSLILSLAMTAALSAGIAAPARAAGPDFQIDRGGVVYSYNWPAGAGGGGVELYDNDIMTILPTAAPVTAAITISIAADANVTINGNAGTTYNNLCISENSGDTVAHTVTVNNLKISAPVGSDAYTQCMGVINLSGTNVFTGDVYGIYTNGTTSAITSTNNGTLSLSANTRAYALNTSALLVHGNAGVTSDGVSALGDITIDKDASLIAVGAVYGIAGSGGSHLPPGWIITNNGKLTVKGGAGTQPFYDRPTIKMGPNAVTTLTNNMGGTMNYDFTMIPASGYQWQLTNAAVTAPGTVASSPANITVAAGATGTITLAAVSPVCAIGAATYTTLDDALAAVTTNAPTTIRLLDNIIYNDGGFYASINNRQFTFDLNGKTLDFDKGLLVQGNSVIGYSGSGSLTCDWVESRDHSSVTLTSVNSVLGHASISHNAIYCQTGGSVNVEGNVTISGAANGIAAEGGNILITGDINDTASTDPTITGSVQNSIPTSIEVRGNVNTVSSGIYVYNGATATINGVINAAGTYIVVGSATKTAADITTPTTKVDYLTYTDGATPPSTVWVKAAASGAAPTISNLTARNITQTSASVYYDLDKAADVYVAIFTGPAQAMTAAQVKAPTGAVYHGTATLPVAGTGYNYSYSLLNPNTQYTWYFVATNANGDSAVVSVTMTTLVFVPVTNITGVPNAATAGTGLPLTGTVVPSTATNKTITWSVKSAGTTGATITGNTLNTTTAGTAVVTATIVNGLTASSNYTQDFTITVSSGGGIVPTVSSVTVNPGTASVQKGTTQQFNATVAGTGSPAQTVTWSVSGNSDPGTAILPTGLLTIAAGETAATITVKAVSTVDNTKSGTATVTLANVPITKYALTVQAGAGGSVANITGNFAAGDIINISATSNANYRFNGWTTSNGGSFGNANNASTTFTMPGNPATVTANFSLISSGGSSSGGSGGGVSYRTVTFNSNGGSSVSSQTVSNGAKAAKPANPVKEGYTFAGWYTDAGLTMAFDFSKGITGNTTLYAKWTQNTNTEPNPAPATGTGTVNQPPIAPPATTQPSGPSAQWQNPFSDVQSTDWFYGDVQYALSNNLFKGVSAASFAPNGPMTRAMFVTVLWRASGSPSASSASPFKDVTAKAYYSEAVSWAAGHNIVLGISNTLFAPDRQVTREQMAAILYRYEQFNGSTPSDTVAGKQFADANKISDYARNSVNALVAQGIIGGKPGNLFDPQGTATRAEVAALMHRFMAAAQ